MWQWRWWDRRRRRRGLWCGHDQVTTSAATLAPAPASATTAPATAADAATCQRNQCAAVGVAAGVRQREKPFQVSRDLNHQQTLYVYYVFVKLK